MTTIPSLKRWGSMAVLAVVLLFGLYTLRASSDPKLAPYRGRWVLVNVWAGWCAPCMEEMKTLDDFYLAHRDHVMVLGLNADHASQQDLQRFASEHQLHFPLLTHMNLKALHLQHIDQVPMTIVISPRGKVVKTLMGPQTTPSLLQAVPDAAN